MPTSCQHEHLTTNATTSRVITEKRLTLRITTVVVILCEDCGMDWGCRFGFPPRPREPQEPREA